MNKLRKTTALIAVGLIFLLSSCSQNIADKEYLCSYCGGTIFYHQTTYGEFSATWKADVTTRDDKIYHPWCAKHVDDGKLISPQEMTRYITLGVQSTLMTKNILPDSTLTD
jgi:hypothetical protein